jgi:dTDP-4-amino-4,6-dideoxygalactose transaminase
VRVPLLDLVAEGQESWDDVVGAVTGVLRSGTFILGPNVEAFEHEAAAYLGCAHAVGVNSGTDAIAIALRALGVGPGDEVVTTPFTFVATAEAIAAIGARPMFADIDPDSLNLDPAQVEARRTPQTRAVVPVHLFGTPAPMAELPRDLPVVEDAAQAFGATVDGRKVGAIGRAGAFSFFPTKPLGGCGDGGLIATDDPEIAAAARRLRAHGARRKNHSEEVGYNSRLDELQAAVLRVRLPLVDDAIGRRRERAERYSRLLAAVPGVVTPSPPPGAAHALYTVRIAGGRRDGVARSLAEAGIASAVNYPVPLHRLPPYAEAGLVLPEAERAAGEVLSLPLWSRMPMETVDEVAAVVAAALA